MTKGLEALEDIRSWFSCHDYDQHNEMDIIEKELKALEIIKKYYYGNGVLFGEMTKEEFDFLKEVLL